MESVIDLTTEEDDRIINCHEITSNQRERNFHNTVGQNKRKKTLFNEVIEKCLSLENSVGMQQVLDNSLIRAYNSASQHFKDSSDFKRAIHRSITLLERDPSHKYSHIRDLRDILIASTIKKRVKPVTLATNITGTRSDVQEIIDLDKDNHTQDINYYDDVVIIDKEIEKTNLSVNIYKDSSKLIQENRSLQTVTVSVGNPSELCGIKQNEIENNIDTQPKTHVHEDQHRVLCEVPIENCLNNESNNILDLSQEDSDLLEDNQHLIPHQVVVTEDIDANKLLKISTIERDIAYCKKVIAELDEEEVKDDNSLSPYIKSDKYENN